MTTLPRTPSFRLDGRRALVTGAGSGIGLAVACALAAQGAAVAGVVQGLVPAIAELLGDGAEEAQEDRRQPLRLAGGLAEAGGHGPEGRALEVLVEGALGELP